MSPVTGISSRYFSWTSGDPHRSGFKLHIAVLSVLCVMFQVIIIIIIIIIITITIKGNELTVYQYVWLSPVKTTGKQLEFIVSQHFFTILYMFRP